MEELHFVYINANGRIAVHSIQSISYSENHIQGICKNTDRIKTFRKDRILKQYDSPEPSHSGMRVIPPRKLLTSH